MNDKLVGLFDSFQNGKDREFIEEAIRIQDEAEKEGILLRLLGSLAFRYQCPRNRDQFEAIERLITDIDFAASTSHREEILSFFERQGYIVDENVLIIGGGYRYIFENPQKQKHVDIFFDRLEMCHTIYFKDRLNIDPRTISLADLLLEKMQIVNISQKDYKDTAILLLEHEIGKDDSDINMDYIEKVMRDDWGFFHTFTTNLDKLRAFLIQFERLDEGQKRIIYARIDEIIQWVNDADKSLKWKLRAKIGTKIRWYKQVD
jgi:hypothetical protein